MKWLAVFLLVILGQGGALGCLNDTETAKIQFKPRSEAAIITGFFPRNPPELYRARIQRLLAKSKQHTLAGWEYDDLAVAYDRVGDSDQALRWIKEKAVRLQKTPDVKSLSIPNFTPPGRLTPMAYMEYTTKANWGTFLIHRWFKRGRKSNELPDLQQGIGHLREAVRINPDAHSGREWAQIEVAEWIRSETQHETGKFPTFRRDPAETRQGLVGLVELGNAWQSPDVFRMISYVSTDSPPVTVLAWLRAEELADAGAPSLFTRTKPPLPDHFPMRGSLNRSEFRRLRKEADAAHETRTAFIEQKLKQGKHPDVNEDFWDGYRDPEIPQFRYQSYSWRAAWLNPASIVTLIIALSLGGVALILVWRAIRIAKNYWKSR